MVMYYYYGVAVFICILLYLDPSLPQNELVIKENKPLPLILVLGYVTGYSVWSIQVMYCTRVHLLHLQ